MIPTIHATAVAVNGAGVLLIGPPGSGKSDLALRLIDRGARLVADDQVAVVADGGVLLLSAPPAIAGLMEVRGVGILRFPAACRVPACLCVDLSQRPERLPEPATTHVEGVSLPLIHLSPFEASAPLKVELAVAHQVQEG